MGKDLTGERFGTLVVLEQVRTTNGRAKVWLCKCDCGGYCTPTTANLNRGNTKSCGCLQRATAAAAKRKHGATGTRTYRIWQNVTARCRNEKSPRYKDYGGRGITVCDEWKSFENFLADMGECPPGLSIDREDNDGPYCKGNCRWATQKEQALNNRRTIVITYKGVTDSVRGWAVRCGRLPNTVKAGLRRHGVTYLDRFFGDDDDEPEQPTIIDLDK